jgi:hypothetical protein
MAEAVAAWPAHRGDVGHRGIRRVEPDYRLLLHRPSFSAFTIKDYET